MPNRSASVKVVTLAFLARRHCNYGNGGQLPSPRARSGLLTIPSHPLPTCRLLPNKLIQTKSDFQNWKIHRAEQSGRVIPGNHGHHDVKVRVSIDAQLEGIAVTEVAYSLFGTLVPAIGRLLFRQYPLFVTRRFSST